MQLSEHLSLDEFTYSPTALRKGISNEIDPKHLDSAKILAEKIFEPIREHRGSPIKINSGYRSAKLNKAIGGSTTSQHMKAQALDLPLTSNEAKWVQDNLNFDQLIYEFPVKGKPSWVHVSYNTTPNAKQRKQVLIAISKDGKTSYIPFKGNEKLIQF